MIEITSESAERVSTILAGIPGGAERAMRGIISRAQSTVRTTAQREITKVYNITQKDMRAESNISLRTKAEDGGIVGEVSFSGFKIPLYRYNVTPRKPTNQPGIKVPVDFGNHTALVSPGMAVKAAQLRGKPQKTFKNAFIAQMKSGHIGMYERDSSHRMPITEVMGSSMAQMAGNAAVLDKVETAAMGTIEKRVEVEISRILNGYNR